MPRALRTSCAKFRAEADAEHVRAGAETVARDAERRRRHWVDARLVDAGRERARVLGWTDCYTFTKALGERYLEQEAAGLPRSIVRPSIIESALARPHPGWIEGFKMAEPIILAYGRGELPDFPGCTGRGHRHHPRRPRRQRDPGCRRAPAGAAAEPVYYHVCSGSRNPLLFRELYELVRAYFRAPPADQTRPGRDRGPALAVPRRRPPSTPDCGGASGSSACAERALSRLPPSERPRQRAPRSGPDVGTAVVPAPLPGAVPLLRASRARLRRRQPPRRCTTRSPPQTRPCSESTRRASTGPTTCRKCTARQ